METVIAKGENIVGRNLERIMKAQGLNPFRLSLKAELGQSRVTDIIRGRVLNPGIKTMHRLATTLDVSIDEFVQESETVDGQGGE